LTDLNLERGIGFLQKGLIGPIKYQLLVHTFENFQKMVDNAIMVEHAHKEMGEQKRKF
jgi:hypothetical protein